MCSQPLVIKRFMMLTKAFGSLHLTKGVGTTEDIPAFQILEDRGKHCSHAQDRIK